MSKEVSPSSEGGSNLSRELFTSSLGSHLTPSVFNEVLQKMSESHSAFKVRLKVNTESGEFESGLKTNPEETQTRLHF